MPWWHSFDLNQATAERGVVVYTANEFDQALAADTVSEGVVLVDEQYYFKDTAGGTSVPAPIAATQVDSAKKIAPANTGKFTVIDQQSIPESIQEAVFNIAALALIDYSAEKDALLTRICQSAKRDVTRWKQHVGKNTIPNRLFDATFTMWYYDSDLKCWYADAVDALLSPTMRALLKTRQLVVKNGRMYSWPDSDAVKMLCTDNLQQAYYYTVILPHILLRKYENDNDDECGTADREWLACKSMLQRQILYWQRRFLPKSNLSHNVGIPVQLPLCMMNAAKPLKYPQRLQLAAMYQAIRNAVPGLYYPEMYFEALDLKRNGSKFVSQKDFKILCKSNQKRLKRKLQTHSCDQIINGRTSFVCGHANGIIDCARHLNLDTAYHKPTDFALATGGKN